MRAAHAACIAHGRSLLKAWSKKFHNIRLSKEEQNYTCRRARVLMLKKKKGWK